LQPWGNAVANVFDRHTSQGCCGIVMMGAYDIVPPKQRSGYRAGNTVMFRPVYFNQVANCRLRGRDAIAVQVRVPTAKDALAAVPMFGNVIRHNEVVRPLVLASNQPDAYWLRSRPIVSGERGRGIREAKGVS